MIPNIHIAGLFVLAISFTFGVISSALIPKSPELQGWGAFQFVDNLLLLGIVGVRIWQVGVQRIKLSPRSGIELAAINVGSILIIIGIPGVLIGRWVFGFSPTTKGLLLSYAGSSILIIGLALFELVAANQRGQAGAPAPLAQASGSRSTGPAGLSLFGLGLLVGAALAVFFMLLGASL